MTRVKQIIAALCLCLLTVLGNTPAVIAGPQQANSTNWGVSEVNFGSGGSLSSCSTSYCSKQSAGELTVGSTSSTNYTARSGANTFREEHLEVWVTGSPIVLGNLDSASTKFGSVSFSVRTFPAYGYTVVLAGNPPKNKAGNSLAAMSSATTSTTGIEQFGINLKANTAPNVGAEAAYVPDNTFAFGVASAGYDTQNNFKFNSGDVIAQSPKGYGQTNFTLSAIANIAPNTPAGEYAGIVEVIAVPTF
jgi:hypothetical protein